MKRFLRMTFAALAALAVSVAPLFAQEAEDTSNHVSHGVDYVVAFFLLLLILFPVCKPSRPF